MQWNGVINAAECEFSSTEGPRPQEVPASSTGSEIHTHVEKKPEIEVSATED